MTLLSIAIPTYNRADQVDRLVKTLVSVAGDFEICLHDDGSTDDTMARIGSIDDPRIRVTRGANAGRAQALLSAVGMATGRYVMLFDDDDLLYPQGLAAVLADCAAPLPAGCAGFVYHLETENGRRIGSDFPVERSNFVALRADHKVTGDKKEVVLRWALIKAMPVPGRPRRVPTALYWTRIALELDVLCRNAVIGRKTYLVGGMTDRISQLKAQNPQPMWLLARARIAAFGRKRYRSIGFLMKSLAACCLHGTRTGVMSIKRVNQ